jgi:hypothetical protein
MRYRQYQIIGSTMPQFGGFAEKVFRMIHQEGLRADEATIIRQ